MSLVEVAIFMTEVLTFCCVLDDTDTSVSIHLGEFCFLLSTSAFAAQLLFFPTFARMLSIWNIRLAAVCLTYPSTVALSSIAIVPLIHKVRFN